MMELNGINYTEKHLTDEEKAVVDAMRMGGKAQVNFFHSDYSLMTEHLDSLDKDNLFVERANYNLTHSAYFQAISKNVQIGHFIDK